jgi:hypothetical protein
VQKKPISFANKLTVFLVNTHCMSSVPNFGASASKPASAVRVDIYVFIMLKNKAIFCLSIRTSHVFVMDFSFSADSDEI